MVPWGAAGRMPIMPKIYPKKFRDDVVAVAQRREPGVTIKQIAEDFGISETCLQNWLRKSEIEAGDHGRGVRRTTRPTQAQPGPGAGERGAAPGGGVFVAGEFVGKRLYPLVSELAADGIPVTVTCRVLKLAR